MADLEYSPSLDGFVPFGTVATALFTTDPTFEDALFVRQGAWTVPFGLAFLTLTVSDATVILPPGQVITQDVTLSPGGTLQLGPDLASADPNSLAVLTGTLTLQPGATTTITAGLLAGPTLSAGTIDIQGYATIAAPFTATTITSTPASLLTLSTDLQTDTLLTLLNTPTFTGSLIMSGTLDNTSATLDAASLPNLTFSAATITAGTLLAGPTTTYAGTTLDTVTLHGTLTATPSDYLIATGLLTGDALLAIDGSLGVSATTTLDGPQILLGANALLYAAGLADLTIAPATTIELTDTATLSFPGAGAHVHLQGGLTLDDSVSPYSVTLSAGLGTTIIDASATLRIGANAALKLDTTLTNASTIDIAGGTLELVRSSPTLGAFTFTGADSKLRLDTAGQTLALTDLADSDLLVLPAASKTNPHVLLNGTTLDIISGTNKLAARLILSRSDSLTYSAENFTFTTDGTALALTTSGIPLAACYAQGTRITTPHGQVPIEHLRVGDHVTTASGRSRKIIWTGVRTINLRNHPSPHDANPIRIHAHAFGPNLPARDLLLSPDHAIHAEAALIPIRYLLNGVTITQEYCPTITWHHLELPSHDIILAENLPAESYLDTGNRNAFANTPPSPTVDALQIWATQAHSPLVTNGDTIPLLRATLQAQALRLGHHLTQNPAPHLLQTQTTLHLLSRTHTPSHHGQTDPRTLGLPITALTIDTHPIPLTHPTLTTGWHPPEPTLRWTTGNTPLPTPKHSIQITTAPISLPYWA